MMRTTLKNNFSNHTEFGYLSATKMCFLYGYVLDERLLLLCRMEYKMTLNKIRIDSKPVVAFNIVSFSLMLKEVAINKELLKSGFNKAQKPFHNRRLPILKFSQDNPQPMVFVIFCSIIFCTAKTYACC